MEGLNKGDARAMQARCMCDAMAPHGRCAEDPVGLAHTNQEVT